MEEFFEYLFRRGMRAVLNFVKMLYEDKKLTEVIAIVEHIAKREYIPAENAILKPGRKTKVEGLFQNFQALSVKFFLNFIRLLYHRSQTSLSSRIEHFANAGPRAAGPLQGRLSALRNDAHSTVWNVLALLGRLWTAVKIFQIFFFFLFDTEGMFWSSITKTSTRRCINTVPGQPSTATTWPHSSHRWALSFTVGLNSTIKRKRFEFSSIEITQERGKKRILEEKFDFFLFKKVFFQFEFFFAFFWEFFSLIFFFGNFLFLDFFSWFFFLIFFLDFYFSEYNFLITCTFCLTFRFMGVLNAMAWSVTLESSSQFFSICSVAVSTGDGGFDLALLPGQVPCLGERLRGLHSLPRSGGRGDCRNRRQSRHGCPGGGDVHRVQLPGLGQ